ncbi:Subtilisin-like protease SBT5.4 [Cardamine amara subsp. amara]|uniref:Subtilisin-like protease SBT5.4 n=1 Tax=Cardamine amara subsp. amara TaxID=228776 RepID=A0ABD1AYK6_CARAN
MRMTRLSAHRYSHTMCLPSLSLLLLFITLFSSPAFALRKSYIVYLGSHAHPPQLTSAHLNAVANSHRTFLASFLGSHQNAQDAIFYSYKRHINGFAAVLDETKAAEIAKHPDVISVFLNKGRKLHTTHSWDFMLLEKNGIVRKDSLWNQAGYGEDIIIANFDTGVWPESKSFSDEGYGAVPARWKGRCDKDVPCNRKLIGARYFNKGYLAYTGFPSNATFETSRDHDGHGSHTLSTAAGNFVPGANVFGLGNGTASGGSPKARVAAYKVCWPPVKNAECFDADIIAAFDAAIEDGVDVLSLSLGGDAGDYITDGIAIGSFHAVKKGVTVVCSAGNSGPKPGTVSNVAPWIITVGASSMDREFQAFVVLKNGQRFKGTSLSKPLAKEKMYSLINAADAKLPYASGIDALLCKKDSLDSEKVKGKILVCLRGDNSRVEKGEVAAVLGAVGMILCNDKASGNEILSDAHVLPASQIDYKDGLAVFTYLESTKDPQGYIKAPIGALNTKPAPFMASFSSRGPNSVTPGILKPDITAPGVNIIAAFTDAVSPTDLESDHRRIPFNTESGTSMSCPHIAGIVGLLKNLHPQWSSAAIRSAIMTTSRTRDNRGNPMVDQSFNKANPFSYGSGHVQPNKAADPGLVYDLATEDYLDFLCAIGYNNTIMVQIFAEDPNYKCPQGASLLDFNYPSITVSNLTGSVTVTRKLKNVGPPATYNVRFREPLGVKVCVEPKQLRFSKTEEVKKFKMTLQPKSATASASGYVFGELTWTDARHDVRSPIVVEL